MTMNSLTMLTVPYPRRRGAIALALFLLISIVDGRLTGERLSASLPTNKGTWSGTTLSRMEIVVEQGERRAKGSKPKGSESAVSKDRRQHSDLPTWEPNPAKDPTTTAKEPVTVSANGLTMKLGGVYPLAVESRAVWEQVTGAFLEDDILRLTNDLEYLDVAVSFVSQSPPHDTGTRRLEKFGVRRNPRSRGLLGSQGMLVDISFDVVIEIVSKVEDPDANRYVAHAFDDDARKIAYMRKLLATGDPAFANIGTVTLDANISSTKTEGKSTLEVAGIVLLSVFGVLCLFTITYILVCTRRSSTRGINEEMNEKDQSSHKHARTETASASSEDNDYPNKTPKASELGVTPSGDDASLASYYYDGNISVAWSLDTDVPQTPRVANSKTTMLGRMSRESSEGSLFIDDGIEVQTPIIGPIHGAPMVVSPLLNDGPAPHVVTPPQEKELYEM